MEKQSVPNGWVVEAKRLLTLAVPLMLQNLLATALSIMTIAFVGHLNEPLLLSAVVMGTSLFNITGLYIITGFSAGLDTLIGQAYGAGHYRLVGVTLQRALALCLLLCVPIALLWYHLAPVLLFLQQPPDIVEGATRFLLHTSPSLFLTAIGQCLARYMTAQQMVSAPLMAALAEVFTAPIVYWLLIHRLDLGLTGAAYAFNFANLVFTATLLGHTVLHERALLGGPHQTWHGLSRDALRGWGQYLHLALPACAMVCAEFWMFECVILEAGLLPHAEVAQGVMGMMQQICTFLYMLPYGMGSAANVLIANALGSGQAAAGRRIFHVALSMQMCIQVVVGLATYHFRRPVVAIFTNSPEVLQLAEAVLPLVALNVVGDGLTTTQTGVLRGCGRQQIGAVCNLISYWVVGVPLTYILGISYQLGVNGFWMALAFTMNLQGLVLLTVLLSLNWHREVERAQALVGQSHGLHGVVHVVAHDAASDMQQPLLAQVAEDEAENESVEDMQPPLFTGLPQTEVIHITPYGPVYEWQQPLEAAAAAATAATGTSPLLASPMRPAGHAHHAGHAGLGVWPMSQSLPAEAHMTWRTSMDDSRPSQPSRLGLAAGGEAATPVDSQRLLSPTASAVPSTPGSAGHSTPIAASAALTTTQPMAVPGSQPMAVPGSQPMAVPASTQPMVVPSHGQQRSRFADSSSGLGVYGTPPPPVLHSSLHSSLHGGRGMSRGTSSLSRMASGLTGTSGLTRTSSLTRIMVPTARGIRQSLVYEVNDLARSSSNASLLDLA